MTLDLDHTARLPPELVHRILDGFSFKDLQPILALCVRWRQIALADPAYWSSISLTSCTTAATSLFLTRLARCGTRPTEIYIHISEAPDCVPPSIFPALRDHLHHIAFLDVALPVALLARLLDYLTSQAPFMIFVSLDGLLRAKEEPLPVIPTNLFGCYAPALVSINIHNVVLPQSAAVPALSNVSRVCAFWPFSMPVPNVFQHFPSMVDVEFRDPFFIHNSAYFEAASWHKVSRCTFSFQRTHPDSLLPLAVMEKVSQISIVQPHAHEIENLARTLPPPYYMQCRHRPENPTYDCLLIFTQTDWLRRREIIDTWAELVDPTRELCTIFRSSIIRDVVLLDVPSSHWGPLVNLLPRMESLEDLNLCVEDGDDISTLASSGVIRCPALKAMGIISLDRPQTLSADHAAAFARMAIAEADMRFVFLYIQNVQLLGSSDNLQVQFVNLPLIDESLS